MKITLLVIIITSFIIHSCAPIKYTYFKPRYIYDGIETASLKDVNMDSSVIDTLIEEILNGEFDNIHSILILKDNKLVCEEYFKGYSVHSDHILKSLGKSIVSTLIGIAIDKKYIQSSDALLYDLLPQYQSILNKDIDKKNISLKHILSMSTGLNCGKYSEYPNNCGAQMWKADDPVKYLLALPLSHKPGEHFLYNDGTPAILQVIITQNSKMRYDHFRNTYLFGPLGINTDTNRDGLTSRELAKIGLLYLNKGKWQDQQILSTLWVEETIEKHQTWRSGYYGYLWWIGSLDYKNRTIDTFYAAGNGGQFIFIIPEVNMVAVFTGGNYNNMEKTIQPVKMLEKYILPSILQ